MAEKKRPERPEKGSVAAAEPSVERLQLEIDWVFPEGLIGRYANHLTIQNTQHEVHLSFFEFRPPLVLGEPEEVKKYLTSMGGKVKADCVARIVVTKERFTDFVTALQGAKERMIADSDGEKGTGEQ